MTHRARTDTLESMEVHFPPELQARLAELAAQQGRDPTEIIEEVLSRYLEDEARFLKAVDRGIEAAERGEFIEEEEMHRRIEQMFRT